MQYNIYFVTINQTYTSKFVYKHQWTPTGINPLDISATLSTPSGTVDDCEVRDREGSLFEVKLTPFEAGINVISLKQKGIHMLGDVTLDFKSKNLESKLILLLF